MPARPSIRILTDQVANQIAAGEVIERPVAVVKELVENSLDAGATRLQIEIRRGGKQLVKVTDDGCGLTSDEALLAIERHATSKIRAADDLLGIRTFGFRGEALPSIASVSRFTLRSRVAGDETGTELLVDQGKIIHVKETAAAEGTSIEVAHLFNSVPARRKFLKTDQTETAHIVQLVRLLALAHPRVAFQLILDGREVLQLPRADSGRTRLGEIWGRTLLKDLIPFERRRGDTVLHGFLGRHGLHRSVRHELVTIVNGRPVESRTLTFAILEAYTGAIPKGRYPVAFVFLEIDPALVDVNVHPAKREIRFRDEGSVRYLTVETVLDTLQSLKPNLPAPVIPLAPDTQAPAGPPPAPLAGQTPAASPAAAVTASPASGPPVSAGQPVPTARPDAPVAPAWRWIGPYGHEGVLFASGTSLILVHLKAARERVLYEDILRHFTEEKIPVQTLLLPRTFEWEPLAARTLEENRELLAENGFEIESYGANFFRLYSTPEWFEPEAAEEFLRDVVDLLRDGQLRPAQTSLFREKFAALAARAATTPRRFPLESEVRHLLGALFACRQPLTCPRGQPTLVEWNNAELESRLGRKL